MFCNAKLDPIYQLTLKRDDESYFENCGRDHSFATEPQIGDTILVDSGLFVSHDLYGYYRVIRRIIYPTYVHLICVGDDGSYEGKV